MSDDLKQKVMTMLKEILEEDGDQLDHIGPDDDLSAFGVNSMTFIRLVLALEMEFGVSWDDDDLQYQNFLTINNIVHYVSNSIPSQA
jgi:acyl carrier protein